MPDELTFRSAGRPVAGPRASVAMKLLFDLLPVLLFFVAYQLAGIYAATGVAIAATVGQIGWLRLRRRKIEPMQWASLAIIGIFGGMTLVFRDQTFIQWKPTVLYGLFAIALLGAERLTGRNPMQALLGGQLALPGPVWQRLTAAWAGFFAVMAGLNLLVAYRFSLDTWVEFKLFGTLGLTLAFAIGQAFWVGRHLEDPGR